MNNVFWRHRAAAILAAGLLTVAAVAQEGASGEVKIEGEKPPAAPATAVVKPAAKPVKPTITNRDPFVNLVNAGTVSAGSTSRVRAAQSSGATVRPAASVVRANPGAVAAAAAAVEPEPEVIVPAPEVTITGIVKSRGGHQAIINSGSNSHIVSAGQKIGDYRVAAITDTAVTFTNSGKSFKIPIESQFGLKK